MSRKQTFIRKLLLLTFTIAFPLSFVWAMLQMFAYAPFGRSTAQTWLFCGSASLVDALYIALRYWFGIRLTRDQSWLVQLNKIRLLAITLAAIIKCHFNRMDCFKPGSLALQRRNDSSAFT